MNLRDIERAQLAIFAAREAGPSAALEQMMAICYCIRNRVRAGWEDGSWLRVLENAQTHAAHDPLLPWPLDPNQRAFQMLIRDIDDLYYGDLERDRDQGGDLEQAVGTQKYWSFANRPVRDWFKQNIQQDKENHAGKSQMGLMMFFE